MNMKIHINWVSRDINRTLCGLIVNNGIVTTRKPAKSNCKRCKKASRKV